MAENKTGPVGAGEIAEELPRPPILVVDDNEINRYTTRKTLERIGFPVVEAASGEAGLELLGLGSAVASSGTPLPWLVILDVHLPGLNGFEVCRRIKTAPASASVLVLHLSNHRTGSGDLVTGLESGADGYLTFPIDPPVLAAHVRSLFRLARAEKVSREAEERLRSANEVLECQVGERTSELTDALTALEVLLAERLALVARLVTAQEDERRRISRELHDEMGQLITGFGLQLKALENTILAAASAAPSCSRETPKG